MSELQVPWMNDKLGMSLTPAGVQKAYEHTVSAQALPIAKHIRHGTTDVYVAPLSVLLVHERQSQVLRGQLQRRLWAKRHRVHQPIKNLQA